MHSDISQSSTYSSSRLTPASFEMKLQFVKVPSPLFVIKTAPPCKQVDRTTQPHTHTQIHTHKQQSVHAYIHSFIHSFIQSVHHIHSITLSQERTKHHHCHSSQSTIIHPSTMHCTDHSVWHSYMHAWRFHDSRTMEWNAYRLPTTTLQKDIHTCVHA